MEKKIYLSDEGKAHLRKVFNVSNVTVWKALTFVSDNSLARKIRHVALSQLHGVPSWDPEEMETVHDGLSNTMTQTFGSRVKLVLSKSDSTVVVYVDDVETRREKCESIPAFMRLQEDVQSLALSL